MEVKVKKSIFIAAVLALCVILLSWGFFYLSGGAYVIRLALIDVIALLVIFMGLMADLLRRNLKVTLYAYTNIALIGGILFCMVLTIVFTINLVALQSQQSLSLSDIFRWLLDFPRLFSYYAVFVIFAISVLIGVSNIALIRHEGFRPHNALSILMVGFYIGGTVLVYYCSDLLRKYILTPQVVASHPAYLLLSTVLPLFLLLMLCYFECIFAGCALLGYKVARVTPDYDKDYIIILGCAISKSGGLLPLLKGRVNRAIRFAWQQEIATGKAVKYVPSGGQGPDEVISEGSAMELYLLSHGAEEDEVFPEKRSTTTWENLCFSKQIIEERTPNAKVAIATTNYHILRSGILARMAGLDAQGVAGDTKWYFWPNGFIREFFAILSMKKRAHGIVAILVGIACAAVGALGYLVHLI